MSDHKLDNVPECPECGKKLIGVEEHYGVIDCPEKGCKGRVCCYITTPMKTIYVNDGVAREYRTCGQIGFNGFNIVYHNPQDPCAIIGT